jgi:hypothetical protein
VEGRGQLLSGSPSKVRSKSAGEDEGQNRSDDSETFGWREPDDDRQIESGCGHEGYAGGRGNVRPWWHHEKDCPASENAYQGETEQYAEAVLALEGVFECWIRGKAKEKH